MAMLHELVATRRRRAAQHALRRRGRASVSTTSSLRAIKPDLVYCHTRGFEHGHARSGCPATTRPAPRWPAPTGSTADSTTTASRSGRSCRWATPATASSPPSAWCRRSTTATAPGRGSSSTRRSCTRSCSTRRSPGACADGSRHGDRPQPRRACSSVTTPRNRLYETADGWLCVAAVTDEQRERAGVGARRRQGRRRHRVRRVGAGVPHPQRRRSGSRASTPPACRARCRAPTSSSVSSTIPR